MIAVDASIALKLVLNEADSARARALWDSWLEAGERLVAPELFQWETLSAVRGKVHRGILPEADGELAYRALASMPLQFHEPDGLLPVAWRIARRFNRPTVYDCCYLALAEILGCELWTADRRLANAVGASLPWVRVL